LNLTENVLKYLYIMPLFVMRQICGRRGAQASWGDQIRHFGHCFFRFCSFWGCCGV